jgi:arthrofactin-type cyclic lipopeptide synthetase C
VEIVRPLRSLAYTPVFQVMFSWQNSGASAVEIPGLRVTQIAAGRSFAKFDLTLTLAKKHEGSEGSTRHDSGDAEEDQ